MKNPLIHQAQVGVVVLSFGLVLQVHLRAAQFVDLAVEIQTFSWIQHGTNAPSTVETKSCTIHCVTGTNTWLIKGDFQPTTHAWWFTGSNIVAQTVLLNYPSERKELFHLSHPDMIIGKTYTRVFGSPGGKPDASPALMAGTTFKGEFVTIPWLAFCSGSYLKHSDTRLPLLRTSQDNFDLDYSVKTTVFEEDMGLPRSVDFYMPSAQPVFQYRVLQSTNALGRTFPTYFHLAQYRKTYPPGGWELDFTATGKVVSIGVGSQPQLPTETQTTVVK